MSGTMPDNPQGGYDPIHFENLFSVEDRHFWFQSRNNVISILAHQLVAGFQRGYWVLEMGCGNGNVLQCLERACRTGKVIGMDLYHEALCYARTRTSCALVRGDIRTSPFKEKFALIGIFDVLEHIADDRRVLSDLWNVLDDQGSLLITVPAHPYLWSYFDEVSGHCRRYRLEELHRKLIEAGFEVDFLTHYMGALQPLMWLSRKLRSKWATKIDSKEVLKREVRIVPFFNSVLSWVLSFEYRWIAKRKALPFGTSLAAVARKVPSRERQPLGI